MKKKVQLGFSKSSLTIIYGLECNLRCKMCYIKFPIKRKETIPEKILQFLDSYPYKFKTISWSGWGELFVDQSFIPLLNQICCKYPDIKHTIQTNGTLVDELEKIMYWNNIQDFHISIDGDQHHHDNNRGEGCFEKIMRFLDYLSAKNTNVLIRSILTAENYEMIFDFQRNILEKYPELDISFNLISPYFTQRMLFFYRSLGFYREDESGIEKLSLWALMNLSKDYKVQLEGGKCKKIALTISNGKLYSCCENIYELGDIDLPMPLVLERIEHARKTRCDNCLFDT